MSVFTDYGWCRVEGCTVKDLDKYYQPTTIAGISNTGVRIFYGNPEIQIFNPYSEIQHVIYKVVKLKDIDATDYSDIPSIIANYTGLAQDINAYDKTIVRDSSTNAANYYFKPFVLTESAVVFYALDTYTHFDKWAIILIDEIATPSIVAIQGGYTGQPVPVGDPFNEDELKVTVVYDDGNTAWLKQGYTIDPADKIVTKVGVNTFKLLYSTPPPNIINFNCTFTVMGAKKLEGITAFYDGPKLAYGEEVQRRYIIVTASYSNGNGVTSSATVTDYSFPNGNIMDSTNHGKIPIYYQGYETILDVQVYEVARARLTAYYNGGPVEVGYEIDLDRVSVRINYQSEDGMNGGFESIDPHDCVYAPTLISHEGLNNVLVTFESRYGIVKTYMAVVGVKPEVRLTYIYAEYTGPDVVVSDLTLDPPYLQTFSIERIICTAYYSDGSSERVKHFMVDRNYVLNVGQDANTILVIYRNQHDEEASCTVTITGIAKDDTMSDNTYEISLLNHYPEATRRNNRYRGPGESDKHDDFARFLCENVTALYNIFATLEKDYMDIVEIAEGNSAIKLQTLNDIQSIDANNRYWMTDKRFTSGHYIKPTNLE